MWCVISWNASFNMNKIIVVTGLQAENIMNNNVVNSLKAKINKLQAEIAAIENKQISINYKKLVEETLNLQDGVGEGFVDGDYYAPQRYYSDIEGVKNIRFDSDGSVLAKVESPKGCLLPKKINVGGSEDITVYIVHSKNYTNEIDY